MGNEKTPCGAEEVPVAAEMRARAGRGLQRSLPGLRAIQGLFSRLLIPRQDSFSTINGTHLRMPEKQKAPETLGSRGFVRMGSGRYRTHGLMEKSIKTRKDSFQDSRSRIRPILSTTLLFLLPPREFHSLSSFLKNKPADAVSMPYRLRKTLLMAA